MKSAYRRDRTGRVLLGLLWNVIVALGLLTNGAPNAPLYSIRGRRALLLTPGAGVAADPAAEHVRPHTLENKAQ